MPSCKKKCSRNKICNKTTGRCVLKKGAIGKKLTGKVSKAKKTTSRKKSPKRKKLKFSFKRIPPRTKALISVDVMDHVSVIAKPYRLVKFINNGEYGAAYLGHYVSSDGRDLYRVFKLQAIYRLAEMKDFKKEIIMQIKFSTYNLAPKIHHHEIYKTIGGKLVGIISMDKVYGTAAQIFRKNQSVEVMDHFVQWVLKTIKFMCSVGVIHGDMHFDNIGYTMVGDNIEYSLLDFGLSCCKNPVKCFEELELVQILRSLNTFSVTEENAAYLRRVFYDILSSLDPRVQNTWQDFSKWWDHYAYANDRVYDDPKNWT